MTSDFDERVCEPLHSPQDAESNKVPDKFPIYSDSVEWRSNSEIYADGQGTAADLKRPDSGVGESVISFAVSFPFDHHPVDPFQAELLSEAISFGDLCHTKSSLRLPLKMFPVAAVTSTLSIENPCQNAVTSTLKPSDNCDANNLNENSCAGSVDSLSSSGSSSSADPNINLSNFGKHRSSLTKLETIEPTAEREASEAIVDENAATDLTTDSADSIAKSERRVTVDDLEQDARKLNERHMSTANRQSDSTDEDSGIESIIRAVNGS